MSFLTPFYLLAGLAIALPIVFHMIRRTPQGRQVFGSVMFLSPSPPSMTRRSRIEHWILLLLRSLAIGLLAFAFSRPFLRAESLADPLPESSSQISILLDRSASMQRTGYWEKALAELEKVCRSASQHDTMQLQLFDLQTEPVLTFEESRHLESAVRWKVISERLKGIKPGWNGTAAGQALLEAADSFGADTTSRPHRKKLVLISDMQRGAGWERLSRQDWPEDVQLQVLNVSNPEETNASLQVMQDPNNTDGTLQVRISNIGTSGKEQFQIGWQDQFTSPGEMRFAGEPVSVYVAPGQSRIVAAPSRPTEAAANALMLSGDDVQFDNICYVVPRKQRDVRIVYLGDQNEEAGPDGLRFFLAPLFPSNALRKITISDWDSGNAPDLKNGSPPDWLIIGSRPTEGQINWLKDWLHDGGHALFVARDAAQGSALYDLLGIPAVPVKESSVDDYVMLGRIDLEHPALRQFNDPRFSDFTKVHFDHYREFEVGSLPKIHTLAAMENGFPALAEIPVERGKLFLLTSGWNRNDSSLAVWSKFVPLMNALLETSLPTGGPGQQLTVGDRLPLSKLELGSEQVTIRRSSQVEHRPVSETIQFDQPGLYRFAASESALSDSNVVTSAVNLAPEESRTDTFPLDLLAAAGINLDRPVSTDAVAAKTSQRPRQLINQELEGRQQWWRWLLIAGLAVLLMETFLAAIKSRPQIQTAEA